MKILKSFLRNNRTTRNLFRFSVMLVKRRLWRLRKVSHSFYYSGWKRLPSDLVAGEFSYIGPSPRICPNVQIGKYTLLGPNVTVTGSDHNFDVPGVPIIFSGRPVLEKTVIGSDVWIGDGALIMAGVVVGDGSIIAARAVITKDVAPFSIVAGVPAKVVGKRFKSENAVQNHEAMLAAETFKGELCGPLGDRK